MSLAESFSAWITAAATRSKPGLSLLLAPEVQYNDLPPFRPFDDLDAFIATTVSSEIQDTQIDALAVDPEAGKVAARMIHRGEAGTEWTKHAFVWFEGGKVVRVRSLNDVDALSQIREGTVPPPVPRSASPTPTAPLLSSAELESEYRAYIDSINNHTMYSHFPRFVQPTVTHNTNTLTLKTYADFIETSFEEIKGLHFNIKEIVGDSEKQQIAAWLEFTGTPQVAFRGIEPTGRSVRFTEFVMYSLKEGKIDTVWSLLDFDAYRRCLSGEIDPGV